MNEPTCTPEGYVITHISPLSEDELEELLRLYQSGIYWFNKLLRRATKPILRWTV